MCFFFFQAEDGIRDADVTGVQTCAPISTSITHAWVIDVAYRIRGIEAHQRVSIAEDEASRQVCCAESYAGKIRPAPAQQRSKRLGIERRPTASASPSHHLAQAPPDRRGAPAVRGA